MGTALVAAATKGGIAPVISMFGFSLAIALPFSLFAAFPGWMNSLPKSGGWLNTVKVVLGFLELALAFKFLSNADLVLQTHLLEREVFLAIWITIFGALAFYLFGKIKLPHDGNLAHLSVGRLTFGLVVLAFTIYMIPGLWGAPLKLISGFPPPMQYSESPNGVGYVNLNAGNSQGEHFLPEGAHLGPHGLVAFLDYDKGMAYAKQVNKPVLLDFTGHACVNCRKMEEKVWSDPAVLSVLKNEVVLLIRPRGEDISSAREIGWTTGEAEATVHTVLQMQMGQDAVGGCGLGVERCLHGEPRSEAREETTRIECLSGSNAWRNWRMRSKPSRGGPQVSKAQRTPGGAPMITRFSSHRLQGGSALGDRSDERGLVASEVAAKGAGGHRGGDRLHASRDLRGWS